MKINRDTVTTLFFFVCLLSSKFQTSSQDGSGSIDFEEFVASLGVVSVILDKWCSKQLMALAGFTLEIEHMICIYIYLYRNLYIYIYTHKMNALQKVTLLNMWFLLFYLCGWGRLSSLLYPKVSKDSKIDPKVWLEFGNWVLGKLAKQVEGTINPGWLKIDLILRDRLRILSFFFVAL